MDREQVIVVQETEYTGAGKHPSPQLTFARENGIEVRSGDPRENVPGKVIVIPEHPGQIAAREFPLEKLRVSYIRNAVGGANAPLSPGDTAFLAAETKLAPQAVAALLPETAAREG